MKVIAFVVGLIAFGSTLATAGLLTLYSFDLAGIPLPLVIHSAIVTLDAWLIFALLLALSALGRPSAKQEQLFRPVDDSRLRRAR